MRLNRNLNFACRFIGVCIIILSAFLCFITVRDQMGNDFTITREYAKYLALDLHYISNKLSIEEVTDPAGFVLKLVVLGNALAYFLAGVFLIVAAHYKIRAMAWLFLILEVFNFVIKLYILVAAIVGPDDLDRKHVIRGSTLYIAVTTFCWLTVFIEQSRWSSVNRCVPCSEEDISSAILNETYIIKDREDYTYSCNPVKYDDLYFTCYDHVLGNNRCNVNIMEL